MSSGVDEGKPQADLLNKIRTVLAAHFGLHVEYITFDSHFANDLGLDWFDTIQLTILVEEQFPNLEILERGQIASVGDLIRQIRIVDNEWAVPEEVDLPDALTAPQENQRV
jgi:acyl carrier protein